MNDQKNGAHWVLQALSDSGVEVVFGYPGGAVIPLYHEWYFWKDRLKHYRTAHEQNAVHAADGYARSTGKVGVCFVTSGPGATNTVTGIATAFMDSVPLVVLCGQVPTHLIGKDAFQEVDMTGMTMSITKHCFSVKSKQALYQTVISAFHIATSGRPGPVLIEIPKDLLTQEVSSALVLGFERVPASVKQGGQEASSDPLEDRVETLVQWIQAAKKPLIYAGGGIKHSGAEAQLLALAQRCDIPVVNSLMGLGTIDRRDPLSLGLLGMHGSSVANRTLDQCDLLIALGVRFSDRVIGNPDLFARNAKIVHIDLDPTEHHKNQMAHMTVTGDVKSVLERLLPHLKKEVRRSWHKEIETFGSLSTDASEIQGYFDAVNDHFSSETIFVTDVGQHQMWAAQKLKMTTSRNWVTSGGLGTMGFGIGAALGAKIGNRHKPVVLITGDGSFRMSLHELSTLQDQGIKVDILMLQNGCLGMVRQWQTLFQSEVYAETRIQEGLKYEALAEAFDLFYQRVEEPLDLPDALKQLSMTTKSTLTVLPVHYDEKVLPIVPPGKGIMDFIE